MQVTRREETQTLEQQFILLYPRLRSFAAVVGPATMEPDDLVQEALARLLARDATPDSLEGYLRTAIVNVANDHFRRGGRWRARVPLIALPDQQVDRYPSDDDVQLLQLLDPTARAIVWLADCEDWPYDRIATLLDMREGTVRRRAARARQALRSTMADPAEREGTDR